jgi:hypothetical protein
LQDIGVELDEGGADKNIQQVVVSLLIASGARNDLLGDLKVREVPEMVVVFKDFDDLGEAAGVETECLEKHLVDGGAADEGEVAQIVVVSFEKQRFLFCPLGQLDQPQQMVLCELSSPLVVYVDAADAVPVEA